jgi:hypothetical protein
MSKILPAIVAALGLAVLGVTAGEADARGGHNSGGGRAVGSRPGPGSGHYHRPTYHRHPPVFHGRSHYRFSYRYWHRGWRCYCFYYRPARCWYFWSRVGGCYYPLSDAGTAVPGDVPPSEAMALPARLPPDVAPPPARPAAPASAAPSEDDTDE